MRIYRLFHLESRQSLTRDLCCCNSGVTWRLYDFRYRLLTVSWARHLALLPVFKCSTRSKPSTPVAHEKKTQNSRLLRIPHSTFCGWKDCNREQNQNANIRLHEIFILSELQLRKRGIKIKRRIFHHITNLKSSVSGCLNITN